MRRWQCSTGALLMSLGNSSIALGGFKLWTRRGQLASRRVTGHRTVSKRAMVASGCRRQPKMSLIFSQNLADPKGSWEKTSDMCLSTYFVELNNFLKKKKNH